MRQLLYKCLASTLLVMTPVAVMADEPSFITVGTGDITGVYYPVGGAICRLLNKELDRHGIRCVVESTPGSAYNLIALRRGSLDLAIVQSDWLFHATHGSSIYASAGADTDLRSLLTLHAEDFTIVVRAGSGIHSLEDLRGKRVNFGDPGSGQRNTMDLVLSELGWSYSDLEDVSELQASEMPLALCSGQIDAFIYYVGHPNTSVGEATTFCDSRLIPLPQTLIKRFSEKYPFYRAGNIKGGLYRGNPSDIGTFQLSAVLVANKNLPKNIVSELLRVIDENFEQFRNMHPALNALNKRSVFTMVGDSAPAHPAVKQYLGE